MPQGVRFKYFESLLVLHPKPSYPKKLHSFVEQVVQIAAGWVEHIRVLLRTAAVIQGVPPTTHDQAFLLLSIIGGGLGYETFIPRQSEWMGEKKRAI